MLDAVHDGDLDLALVVRDPLHPDGEMLWTEPVVWVGATGLPVHEQEPLPLALFPQGCVLRARAMHALDECDRRWRVAYSSSSLAAVQAAVMAGLAVAVLGSSTLLPGMRTLGPDEDLPTMPPSDIELHRSPGDTSKAGDRLAQHIVQNLKGWGVSPDASRSSSDSTSVALPKR